MRLMPLVLVASGLAGVAKTAPATTERVLNTFRGIAVQHEVASIAHAIELARTLSQSTPPPGDADRLAVFIRENMSAKSRDPALDLWGTPYRLEQQGSGLVVVSCGPNGSREVCPTDFTPPEPGTEAAGPDDVCEVVP